jgi:hypothetical protein
MRTGLALACLSLLAAGALVVSGFALIVRFHQTNAFKQRQDLVWHVVFCDIEAQVLADKTISLSEKQRAVRFYDGLLVRDIRTTSCGLKVPRR